MPEDSQDPRSEKPPRETQAQEESLETGKNVETRSPTTLSPTGIGAFWEELKQRKVVRVASMYLVAAWIIIQVAAATFEGFGVPQWAFRFVVLTVILVFPIALILAWVFEITSEGIKTTVQVRADNQAVSLSKKEKRRRNLFAYAAGTLTPLFIAGVFVLYFNLKSGSQSSGPDSSSVLILSTEDNDKSIAILPMTNMSPDPENAYFGDGIQEDILTKLSKVEDLVVISRTSTLRYRDTVKGLPEIGAELGVNYLVEGSVRRAGEAVRITVQLIKASVDEHVWAEYYDRKLDDIFAIQAEVAEEIAAQLKTVLTQDEQNKIQHRPTQNLDAYDSYLKFRKLVASGGGNLRAKIALLEEAIAHDPSFAEAWAQLAIECIFTWESENREEPELRTRAYEAMEQAERHGPDLAFIPYAWSSFAMRESRDPEESVLQLLNALAIEPGFYLAHWRLVHRYKTLGRISEAQHHAEIAVRRNPLDFAPNWDLLTCYQRQRKWSEAYALIDKNEKTSSGGQWPFLRIETEYLETGDIGLVRSSFESLDWPEQQLRLALVNRDFPRALARLEEREPESWFHFFSESNFQLSNPVLAALVHFAQDDEDNWLEEAAKARELHIGDTRRNLDTLPTVWSSLAICYALEGNIKEMESAIEIARENSIADYHRYYLQALVEMHIAIAYIVLGENSNAIETLEAASRFDSYLFVDREVKLWFVFDRLRSEPRFQKFFVETSE